MLDRNKKQTIVWLGVLALLVSSACSDDTTHSDAPTLIETSTPTYDKDASTTPAAGSTNILACKLYREIADEADSDENIFFSPLSVSTGLMLVYEGARGETREQFDKLLGLGKIEPTDTHRAYARLIGQLKQKPKHAEGPEYELDIANALWGEQTMPFKQDYLDTLSKHYEAGLASADFRNDPAGQARRINQWVSDQTKGRIEGVLEEDQLSPDTKLVLANAMYFKGRWADEFWEGNTEDKDFYITPSTKVKVPMMRKREVQMSHGSYDGYQAVKLWYYGWDLYMLVLLPNDKDGLAALENKLTGKMLLETVRGLEYKPVNLWLPKWETEQTYQLDSALKKLGLTDAFSPGEADLTGISDGSERGPLFIDKILHKAFISLDEEGTEAAAVTIAIAEDAAADIEEERPKPVEFRCDHPFIYLIRDRNTQATLFMGRVTDPS
jgi:serpin B